MPYFRRRLRAPIKSDKHEITWSNLAQDAGTADVGILLVNGVASADKNASTEVEVGSHVRSMFFEFNIAAETTTNPKVVHWEIVVRPQSVSVPSPNVYYQAGRNLIIKRGMEMLPRDVSTVYKRVFSVRIPRKAQRIGQADTMYLIYRASSTESINMCGFCIYKEFY